MLSFVGLSRNGLAGTDVRIKEWIMKRFEKFTHRQVKSLRKHLKEYGRSQQPKTLHQIRIDIKKIKVILGVIGASVKDLRAHENFIPFREIFRRVGDIREPDVLHQLLLQYRAKGVSIDGNDGQSENLVKAFEADIPQFIKTVKSRAKKLERFSREVDRRDVRQYLRAKKKEVKSQLHPKPRMSMIHKARKSVKEVIYLSEVEGKMKKREAAFYGKMQHQLGQLHDKQVLFKLLKDKKDKVSPVQRELIHSACFSEKKGIDNLVRDYFGQPS